MINTNIYKNFTDNNIVAVVSEEGKEEFSELKEPVYKARILEAGLVKYGDDLVLLKEEAVKKIGMKYKGYPIIFGKHDDNLTAENIQEKRVGVVSDVWFEGGWIWVKFPLTTAETSFNKNIVDTMKPSCQYKSLAEAQGGVYNAISYDKEILDGDPMHITISDEKPRYSNSAIYKNNLEKENNMSDNLEKSFLTKIADKFLSRNEKLEKDNEELSKKVYANSMTDKDDEDGYEMIGGAKVSKKALKNFMKNMKNNEDEEDDKDMKNSEDEDDKKDKDMKNSEDDEEKQKDKDVKSNSLSESDIAKITQKVVEAFNSKGGSIMQNSMEGDISTPNETSSFKKYYTDAERTTQANKLF